MQRSAVSIARRLQDPLAELIKIDPKGIGVGQYQHDMKQARLDEALGGVVEDCVNAVGVDINTASYSLLSYISGINITSAKNDSDLNSEGMNLLHAFCHERKIIRVDTLARFAITQHFSRKLQEYTLVFHLLFRFFSIHATHSIILPVKKQPHHPLLNAGEAIIIYLLGNPCTASP
jgi:hypothetical protein